MAETETRSKAVREWIVGLLLPMAIFAYTYQKDRSDEQSRELDRVSTIIKSLGSTNALERSYARTYIEYLYHKNKAPDVVRDLLVVNVSSAPTAGESEAAVKTLEVIQPAESKSPASSIEKNLPVRIYVQIRSEADRSTGQQAQRMRAANGISVPGIEVVSFGPSATELRYFHSEDKARAEDIARQLTDLGVATKPTDTRALAEKTKARVPIGQLELWLAPSLKFKEQL